MSMNRHYVLAAGGTGGHVIPAQALARELMARGHRVALITDERGAQIPGMDPDVQVHVLPAGRLAGGPVGWLRAALAIRRGRSMAVAMMRTFQPAAVVGFGGYPALPALLAARKLGVAQVIHEQNAVLGRVNRLLAPRVDAIATAYADVARLPTGAAERVHLVGNPVRDAVRDLRAQPFPALDGDSIFRLLVTGGSQGASIMGDVVPEALSLMPQAFRDRLQVTQQCRPEDIERVREAYRKFGIAADLSTYIDDMPSKLSWAHLVISRAGASTIAELTCAGRPAIMVPLPSATDDHQTHNVREIVGAGGGRAIAQTRFTAVELAKQMQRLALEPGALALAADKAASVGRPNATADLADLVEQCGGAPLMDVIRVGAGPATGRRRNARAASARAETQP